MSTERTELSINGYNSDYIDQMYKQWLADNASVGEDWRNFFQGFELGFKTPSPVEDGSTSRSTSGSASPAALPKGGLSGGLSGGVSNIAQSLQGKVDSLMYHYRDIGHFAADLDPLHFAREAPEHLTLESFDLTQADLDELMDPGILPLPNPSPLRDIIQILQDTYCRHIGVEYMHIQDRDQRRWLQNRMESVRNQPELPLEQKMRILTELVEADSLENFLNVRYKGKKRFSLEGGESLNAMLNEIIEHGPQSGIEELTIGMAHRGRLNVLVNIMEKSYDQLFSEFEESWVEDFTEGAGDVKYHRGYSHDKKTKSGAYVRLTLSPNPSHLEFANPMVIGRARAKQRIRKDKNRSQCVPILIHGDAAFPGQGIVAETFNMTHLDGYKVGGAIHIIINNQVGFTTNPHDSHSGPYCTDIAKMIECPIFHVNGDDPEACAFIATLALDYRQKFKNDVVIDMWCFRKYGHNEGDEPMFTQPLLYKKIKQHPPVLKTYSDRLIEEGSITRERFETGSAELREQIEQAQARSKESPVSSTVDAFKNVWAGLTEKYHDDPVETLVSLDALKQVANALGRVPEGFNLHRTLKKLVKTRGEAVEKNQTIDWGTAEMYAYGTLLQDGYAVRLTGQDVERGTFSHRHAIFFDQETGQSYDPLNHINDEQKKFCIHNSPLTESACLSFEYGYSLGDPNMLVIWEAQFGDFANGAQVIFDQFIASAEAKWKRFTGLTCFLPHGYEGAGPEHSSARLERFLTLCANNNMQVVYPTTPAQMFHLLRRQMKRNFRKPLIVMTPKSLLRHPKAVSTIEELTGDWFHHVREDPEVKDPSKIKRLILCSGKIYYDLAAYRNETGHDEVAIARIEQLYPLRIESIQRILDLYPNADMVWAQEEPENMGAWRYIEDQLREKMELTFPYVGRDANASPAVASSKMHRQEQQRILINAIGLPKDTGSSKSSKQTVSA
ncbi:MAG: 2-oxoglutarate dehydrogenase E1 component [Planctomycetota bacterium]|nr:2-oxoglutarate dehydrogenase E1 component [Planctomycetota bacterium]